jgi:capsular exopolysaccharide synthesis family protein
MLHVPTDLARHAIEIRGQQSQIHWSLGDIRDVIVWRRRLIFWAIVAVLVPALIYVAMAPPKYTATTELMTDTKRSPAYGTAGTPDTSVDMVVVESQIETLKSDKIALAVIDKLRLWEDPEFIAKRTPLSYIIGLFSKPGAKKEMTKDVKRQIAAGAFSRALQVERQGRSYVAEISFTSTDPKKAATIANAVAEAYIVDQLGAKLQIAQRSSDWVDARVRKLHDRMDDADKALANFKSMNGIPTNSDDAPNGISQAVLGQRLHELEAAAQSARTTYETFLNRYTQSVEIQQQAFPVTEARVLADASPPLSKSGPKTGLILLLAVVAGGTLGLIGAFAREYVDRLVRSPRQIQRELRARVIGTIPKVKRRPILSRGGPLRLIEEHKRTSWLGATRPLPLAGESLRGIKVALDRNAGAGDRGHVIGITSPRAGVGKTTLAYNLALLSARTGNRTLLIDGDLRRSTLTRYLTPQHRPGLVSLMTGHETSECIIEHQPSLHFLGETASLKTEHPSELLGSAAMISTVEALQQIYNTIIIDLPSLLDCVEVRAAAPAIGVFVIVSEWGRSSMEDLDRALASSDVVVERLLGVVINKVAAAEVG